MLGEHQIIVEMAIGRIPVMVVGHQIIP